MREIRANDLFRVEVIPDNFWIRSFNTLQNATLFVLFSLDQSLDFMDSCAVLIVKELNAGILFGRWTDRGAMDSRDVSWYRIVKTWRKGLSISYRTVMISIRIYAL